MKSIDRKDFIIVGVVEKQHGNKGELRLSFEQKIQLKEWVFIEINNKPVPFFIQSISKNTDQPIVKLMGIDSPDDAARFINKSILFTASKTKRKTRKVDLSIVNYLLIDEVYGELGKVIEVEELPQQLLIHTNFKGKELLIPAVDEFILEVNDKKKIIYLSLPEGILDL